MFMMTNVSVGTENNVETFLNRCKLKRYVEKDMHIYYISEKLPWLGHTRHADFKRVIYSHWTFCTLIIHLTQKGKGLF